MITQLSSARLVQRPQFHRRLVPMPSQRNPTRPRWTTSARRTSRCASSRSRVPAESHAALGDVANGQASPATPGNQKDQKKNMKQTTTKQWESAMEKWPKYIRELFLEVNCWRHPLKDGLKLLSTSSATSFRVRQGHETARHTRRNVAGVEPHAGEAGHL